MRLFALKVNFVEENKKPDCQKMKSLFNPIKPEVWATRVNLRGRGGSYIDIKSFKIDQMLSYSLLNHSKKVTPSLIYGSSDDFTGCDKTRESEK